MRCEDSLPKLKGSYSLDKYQKVYTRGMIVGSKICNYALQLSVFKVVFQQHVHDVVVLCR
jgi:hypothetical protein